MVRGKVVDSSDTTVRSLEGWDLLSTDEKVNLLRDLLHKFISLGSLSDITAEFPNFHRPTIEKEGGES